MVVDWLAVARLSRLVREDTILDRPRYWFVTNTRCAPKAQTFIRCPWCVSMWCAFAVGLLRSFGGRPGVWMSRALAASYVASLAAIHTEPKPKPDPIG